MPLASPATPSDRIIGVSVRDARVTGTHTLGFDVLDYKSASGMRQRLSLSLSALGNLPAAHQPETVEGATPNF
jgi:hypothetical protein